MLAYNKEIYKNPAQVYLDSLDSGISRRNCRFILDGICQRLGAKNHHLFDWRNINYTTFLHLKKMLLDEGLNPTSVNHYLTITRGACLNAWRLGMISTDDYMRIKDVKRAKGRTLPKGRTLSSNEIQSLVNELHGTSNEIALRDSAIIATCYGGGLRRSELCSITTERYKGNQLLITGKGNIENFVYLPDFAKNLLDEWIIYRNLNAPNLPIFTHVKSSGYCSTKPLSPRTIGDIIERRRIACNIDPFTPHDLRRTYATNLIEQGVDLFTVQKIMRHAGIETTRIYDKRDSKAQINAAKNLPF